jgi:membrane protein implicated in regulation of membrane protease activity
MSHTDPENVVGRSAHVMLPIPGEDKPGEVLIAVRGGSEMFIAYCDQPVPAGAQVVVLADRGARTLLVAPL